MSRAKPSSRNYFYYWAKLKTFGADYYSDVFYKDYNFNFRAGIFQNTARLRSNLAVFFCLLFIFSLKFS